MFTPSPRLSSQQTVHKIKFLEQKISPMMMSKIENCNIMVMEKKTFKEIKKKFKQRIQTHLLNLDFLHSVIFNPSSLATPQAILGIT